MPIVLPTVENIEEYLQHVEQIVITTVSSVAPDNVRYAFERLQEDLARFWPESLPQLPDIKMPSLGAFEVPPPPPPLPAPRSALGRSLDWVGAHPWKVAGLGLGVVGAGLLVGYGGRYYSRTSAVRKRRVAATSTERRQVVVVLGGDSPLGLPLILELEEQGYIVIASVCTPEAVHDLEQHTRGYVRAIVLDPSEPATIPYFQRSLASTMSRRFPITVSGDPHSSPSTKLYVQSVISLLTLPAPHLLPPPSPLENLGVQDAYQTYLQATHFTPIQVLQGLLPLMRNAPRNAEKSIVVCIPSIDGRVGLPFAGAQAMGAAATLRGVEVLRREIRVAAITETHEAQARSMKNTQVVVVDVGSFGAAQSQVPPDHDIERATIDWSASEKATYGVAFANAFAGSTMGAKFARKHTDSSRFVDTLVDVVGRGRRGPAVVSLTTFDIILGRIRHWARGDRISVGAGARTYAIASKLPSTILDALLTFPHVLLAVRNALLPVPPRVAPLPPTPAAVPAAQPVTPEGSDLEHDASSENGSDADVESSSGYGSGVGESWVSLQEEAEDHEQAWRS